MTKDQNPSDKACDAYFDNPCAATSGSYYSDRATFYAGFKAGAASRDAEVVSLTNQRDYEYVRAENAEQERDQLREQVKMLREALKDICSDYEDRFDMGSPSTNPGMKFVVKQAREVLDATEPTPSPS